MVQYWKEAAVAEGAGWPEISSEQQARAGYDWHVFTNFIFLMGPDAAVFTLRGHKMPIRTTAFLISGRWFDTLLALNHTSSMRFTNAGRIAIRSV